MGSKCLAALGERTNTSHCSSHSCKTHTALMHTCQSKPHGLDNGFECQSLIPSHLGLFGVRFRTHGQVTASVPSGPNSLLQKLPLILNLPLSVVLLFVQLPRLLISLFLLSTSMALLQVRSPDPQPSAQPGHWSAMQPPWPHIRPAESGFWEQAQACLNKTSPDPGAYPKLEVISVELGKAAQP